MEEKEKPENTIDKRTGEPALALPAPRKQLARTPMFPARYSCGSQIGRGGIGSVWRVHDRQMDRPLAAKVLLPKYKTNRSANERLVREALLAGSIQHPGIPPVYEQGELLSGSKFFTMKLVEGKTLEELLNERKDPLEDRQYFLNVFRQIADAVGFAHSRKVIHRDLKPQNVMVGEFGEVQIMDWGMAKRLDTRPGKLDDDSKHSTQSGSQTDSCSEPDLDSAPQRKSMALESSLDERDDETGIVLDGLTMHGDVVGTPSYMSPEQAHGDLTNMNERSDVFSLGAILYEVLSGRQLYQNTNYADLVRVAGEADTEKQISLLESSEIDVELISICKRCLAKRPDSRPDSGQNVAHSVAKYLEGVEERLHQAEVDRSSAEVRALEETKRRQTFVKMAWVIGIVGCLGALGIGWQWSKANDNLREAERQNEVRKVYFSKSLEAIDKMLTRVGFETLANVPGMGELRRELLQEALGFYQEFVEYADDSSRLDHELARMHQLAGTTHAHLGDHPQAKKSFLDSIDILEELRIQNPEDKKATLSLASTRATLASTLLVIGQFNEAADQMQTCMAVLESGIRTSDADPLWLVEYAEALLVNATILRSTSGINESIEELKRAQKAYAKIPAAFANNRVLVSQATCLSTLGRHLRSINQLEEGQEMTGRAIEIMTNLVEQSPDSPAFRNRLVNLMLERNTVLANKGFLEEAAAGFGEQLKIQETLVRDFPSLASLKSALVRTYALQGAATDSLGRKSDAIELLKAGIALGEELVDEYPQTVDHLWELSYIYKNIAIARSKSRDKVDRRQSIRDSERAYELIREVVEIAPEDVDYQFELATAAQFYGLAISDDLNLSEAEAGVLSDELLLESETILKTLVEEVPDNSLYQYRLAVVRSTRAQVASDVGPKEVAELLELAAEGFEMLIKQLPDHPQYRFQLAGTHDKKATLYFRLGKDEQWESELRKACLTMQQTVEKFGENARLVEYYTTSQNRLAHCLKTRGKMAEAETLFQAALKSRVDFLATAPNNQRLQRKVASSKSNLAWLFAYWYPSDQRDLDVALKFALESVADDPGASENWTCLAYIHFLRNDHELFETAMDRIEATNEFDRMTRAAIRSLYLHSKEENEQAKVEFALANELAQSPDVSHNWSAKLTNPEGLELLERARQAIDVE